MKKNELQVLVVDDDVSFATSLVEFIKRSGYKASAANKVDEALSAIKIKPVHLAIIDCMLPKMNGMELASKFRESRFGQSPIILTSGIFKDKTFSVEAIKKTGAIGFITKPFDQQELKALLDEGMAQYLSAVDVTLNSLVSKYNMSSREKLKAIEKIESLHGYELPVVISLMMQAEFSGYLNLANDSGEIYGLSFKQGTIIKFDSPNSKKISEEVLLNKGIISQEELEEFRTRNQKSDVLIGMVDENLLSPHLIPLLKGEQILSEFSSVFTDQTFHLSVVPDRVREKGAEVTAAHLLHLYEGVLSLVQLDFLKGFFEPWMSYPPRKTSEFEAGHPVLSAEAVSAAPGIEAAIQGEKSIKAYMAEHPDKTLEIYRALYFLSITHLIHFDDIHAAKGLEDHGNRLQRIREGIEGKGPKEIFEYFGASGEVKPKEIEKIYKEFAKANHPDTLSSTASEELMEIITFVYAQVSDAHDILTDPEKRDKYFARLKQDEATKQMQAESIAEEGLNHLRKGRVGVAMPKLKTAYEMHPSSLHMIFLCWADIKGMGERPSPPKLREITKRLDTIPAEERRSPYYYLVQGLLKRAERDYDSAYSCFDKALALDSAFIDARREISNLEGAKKVGRKGSSAMDLLSGDIGELTSSITNFFKKKA